MVARSSHHAPSAVTHHRDEGFDRRSLDQATALPPRDHGTPPWIEPAEYERLARWVADDLADLADPALLREAQALRDRDLDPKPAGALKEVFLETFFPRDRVEAALAALDDPATVLRERLSLREPLPTLNGLLGLAPDPHGRDQLERAAVLVHAALSLHESPAGAGLLGRCQIPGLDTDRIVEGRRPADVVVLFDGRPYLLPAAACTSPGAILSALAAIRVDAPARTPSRPLAALTSATRPICHALRTRLATDPENARTIAALEGAALVLCLDDDRQPSSAASTFGPRLRRENRWFSSLQIIVDACGRAAIGCGYTVGANAPDFLRFGDALFTHSRDTGPRDAGSPGRVHPLSLNCPDDDPTLRQAEAETDSAFHPEDPLYSTPVDWAWFKARRMSPNAALQYLLLLAAHDTWGGETPPTLILAVGRKGPTPGLDWLLAPTHGLNVLRQHWRRRSWPDERLQHEFRGFASRLAARADACRRAPSPSRLFSRPVGSDPERLLPLFLRVGQHHDSAYRGYLFRAFRERAPIDIVTSTIALPGNIAWIGRPGATTLATSRFGVHILPREGRLDFIYIPNHRHIRDLPRLHERFEHWLGKLGELTAPETSTLPQRQSTQRAP